MGTVGAPATSPRDGEVVMTRADSTAAAWWRALPLTRVVRVEGAPLRDLADHVDPLPSDAPAPLFFCADNAAVASASTLTDAVVAAVEQAAIELIPLVVPGTDSPGDHSSLVRDAARARAVDLARSSAHFGPYLAHLAAARASARPPRTDTFSRETRLTGAARVVAQAHGRDGAVVILDVPADAPSRDVAAAAEWLCRTGVGVWLTGDGAMDVDRCPAYRVDVPAAPTDVATIVDRFRPASYPPVVGHPHAASAAEDRLYRLLSAREWATGRGHNQVVRLSEIGRPFTVDVVWARERIAVEIDGPEHRSRHRFSDDRSRDNLLQTRGWMVLRFTNDDVLTDHESVVATIEQAVHRRRAKGTPT
ncbi:endonuclease domain-containing protein [Rhodococcoides corynebacterioides]|uniref:endonuclease domain-containing protein n=2 Tax=Rhodococcoides corynebacterioides TaxID=53972 RepID=UPI0021C218D5|nr:endonuclease domain-containing protein [Rhodococcus corynebacterioides]